MSEVEKITIYIYDDSNSVSLEATVFEGERIIGRFETCSCKPTPGGRLPSSVQHHEISLVFVTHTTGCPSLV
jgi:hypothetical protein